MAKPNHKIVAGIFKLLESEAEARHGYESFLADHPDVSSADAYAIQEIHMVHGAVCRPCYSGQRDGAQPLD